MQLCKKTCAFKCESTQQTACEADEYITRKQNEIVL